ncbi:MAG: glycyl-radical enzyme activating protein, partial [Oscillospiraceae bacterium]|nr:glycyl-radical enzyme activating protein [Oscillospiraceae bacterium]
ENACRKHLHHLTEKEHLFAREECVRCGACAAACPTEALNVCGEQKEAEEIIETVLRDRMFYEESGGGMTLSGGEPLAQFDFSLELLRLAREKGLHTAVETCGYSQRDLTLLHDVTDLWLFDIKLLDEEKHRAYTGVSNERILQNLRLLDSLHAKVVLRCPVIPDVNFDADHFSRIAQLAGSLQSVIAIHLEPYHPLGISKAEQLGMHQAYENRDFLNASDLSDAAEKLREQTGLPVQVL